MQTGTAERAVAWVVKRAAYQTDNFVSDDVITDASPPAANLMCFLKIARLVLDIGGNNQNTLSMMLQIVYPYVHRHTNWTPLPITP